MPRRIEVELTSTRDDGTWTWRAAGARQPKGELDGGLLYAGAKVGDVVRADADFDIDGITVTAVLPPKGGRVEPERLEIIGPPRRDEELVTTTLAPKSKGRSRDRDRDGDRPRRDGDGPRGDRPRREPRGGQDRARDDKTRAKHPKDGEDRRERPPRPERPAAEAKPKPKRLRPGRVHRTAVLAEIPEEQKAIAEQVVRGGVPAVRQAIEKQNEDNRQAGQPEIAAEPLVAIAEDLVPRLRAAEWHDRADAALADVAELDLRDLRSVVVAADDAARDETTRALADQLREALTHRVEQEQAAWLAEISSTLSDGRVVRALRLSSRPPKAGAPLPPDLATRLSEAAAGALTADTGADRFATVLDALAYSPVRQTVTARGLPAEPGDELVAAVKKLASRLPQIAAQFGIEAPAPPARGRGPRPGLRGRGSKGAGGPVPPPPVPPPPPLPTAIEPAPEHAAIEPAPEHAAIEPAPEHAAIEPAPEPVAALPATPVDESAVAPVEPIEAPAVDQSTHEEPAAVEAIEAPAVDQSTHEEPAPVEPIEAPAVDQSTHEEPAADPQAHDEPAVDA